MAKLQICCDMTKQPPLILHFRMGAEGAERIKQRKKAGLSQIKFVSLLTDYTLIYTHTDKTRISNMSQQPQLVDAIVEGIREKKGRRIAVVDLNRIVTAPAKYFVVCEGNTPQQIQALTRSVGNTAISMAGERAAATIGQQEAQWVAMDFGTVLVHILLPELREFYDIENLWEDANITWLPEED